MIIDRHSKWSLPVFILLSPHVSSLVELASSITEDVPLSVSFELFVQEFQSEPELCQFFAELGDMKVPPVEVVRKTGGGPHGGGTKKRGSFRKQVSQK